ncbi:MAG: chemotaxis protein CheW [Marinilabiliales bacterium]|nr:MAG: chemotaxis protein CheW [Marinilabiliales bacterium]
MANDTAIQSNSYLSFKVGDELFSAHVSKVLNILEMTKITKVPQAPDYMLGVINLRGTVLPVVDTRIKFGIQLTEFTAQTCIIVMDIDLEGDSVQVGALVDSVQEVLEVEEKDILPPPSIGNKFRSEFIRGIMRPDDEFIMVLDMDRVFSSEELMVLKDSNASDNKEKKAEKSNKNKKTKKKDNEVD